jgi:glutamate dehydrogenase (NAD(P)+)
VAGYGVAEVTDEAVGLLGLSIAGVRVAIQGFGAVGRATAKRLGELGATVVAVSSVSGTLHDPDGLDVPRLLELATELGDDAVKAYGSGPVEPTGHELRVPAEVLVPAATQDVIDEDLARDLSAKLIIEGANLPTSPAAQRILHQRGVTLVPDFIANAGGVVAAAFAMDGRYSGFRLEPQSIFATVSARLRPNTLTVLEESRRQNVTTHEAARRISQERVMAAMDAKGRLPA